MLLCCFTTTRPEPLHTSLTLSRLELHEKWHTALARALQWLLPPNLHKGFAGLCLELAWREGKWRECHMWTSILAKFELWAVTPAPVNIFDFMFLHQKWLYTLYCIACYYLAGFLGITQDPWHIQVHNYPVSDPQILTRLQVPKPILLQNQDCTHEDSNNTCNKGHNHCLNSYSGLDPRELLLWGGLATLQSKWPFETNQWFYSSTGVLKQQLLKQRGSSQVI